MQVDSRGPPPEESSQKRPKEKKEGPSAQEGRPPLGASQRDLAAGSQRPQVSKVAAGSIGKCPIVAGRMRVGPEGGRRVEVSRASGVASSQVEAKTHPTRPRTSEVKLSGPKLQRAHRWTPAANLRVCKGNGPKRSMDRNRNISSRNTRELEEEN
ncbi:unnamed protein product [Calypogeia fissa]